ncbi:MAG: CRISPR-associated CARF protein Csa3 [Desulfurococcaceae archaeon]
MRLFICPLGFHEDFVLRALIRRRASPSDRALALVCGPAAGGVLRAWESLTAQCNRQGLPRPELLQLTCSDAYAALGEVRRAIESAGDAEVVLCAGGGMRLLTIVALLALVALRRRFSIHYEPEGGEQGRELFVGPELSSAIYEGLSELERKVISLALEQPGIRFSELSRALGIKEKTARNVASRLRRRGLLEKRGRGEGLFATPLAAALFG